MIGFLNIYKPSGMTSNAVVQQVKKKFNINKIGHMGTLDPMACGILPLAIGKATRLFDYMLAKVKTYNAIFEFGYETDTLDATGKKLYFSNTIPNQDDVLKAIKKLIGKQDQMPPKYSAKSVNGSRAYELARKGIDFELKPKEIEIFDMQLIEAYGNSYKFSISCSAGTYIRSICRDLAYKLGSYATMTFLERTTSANFNIDNSIHLNDALKFDIIDNLIISPFDVFENYDIIYIDNKQTKDLKDGKTIPHKYLSKNTFIVCGNTLIGVCKGNKNYLKLDTYLEE